MEDGKLVERVEGFATWFMNENSLFGDRHLDTVIDEFTDDLSRSLSSMPPLRTGHVSVLGDKFDLSHRS